MQQIYINAQTSTVCKVDKAVDDVDCWWGSALDELCQTTFISGLRFDNDDLGVEEEKYLEGNVEAMS